MPRSPDVDPLQGRTGEHRILTPQHVKVWYETVFAFLAHHVLGEEWDPPAILR